MILSEFVYLLFHSCFDVGHCEKLLWKGNFIWNPFQVQWLSIYCIWGVKKKEMSLAEPAHTQFQGFFLFPNASHLKNAWMNLDHGIQYLVKFSVTDCIQILCENKWKFVMNAFCHFSSGLHPLLVFGPQKVLFLCNMIYINIHQNN